MDFPPEMGDYFNDIGVEAVRLVGNEDAKILFYAEVIDGLEHMIFRYAEPGESKFRCREDIHSVADAMRDAWEYSRSLGSKYQWRGIIYRVEDRKMAVEILYEEDIDPELSMYDKEDKILEKYYPGMSVEENPC
jgi:hypothetical protein